VECFAGVCLSWGCSPLMAMTFSLSGVRAEPELRRTRVPASQLVSGNVIAHDDRVQIVLSVQRPADPKTAYKFEILDYLRVNTDTTRHTKQVRIVIDPTEHDKIQLVRHSEPDLQCPILRTWKQKDLPSITEQPVAQVTDLQPGDAVCIREKSDAHPLETNLPGLHAIVKGVNKDDSKGLSVDVICFGGEGTLCIGAVQVPEKGTCLVHYTSKSVQSCWLQESKRYRKRWLGLAPTVTPAPGTTHATLSAGAASITRPTRLGTWAL
ncbi:hypothetical protein BOX15_Mlig017806g1, partial [Macrostomum lignano]